MTTDKLSPIHPGEVLLEEFLKPMELSQNRLALGIGVSARRVNEIIFEAAFGDSRHRPAVGGVTSELHINSGWVCKRPTTPSWPQDQLGDKLERQVRVHTHAI